MLEIVLQAETHLLHQKYGSIRKKMSRTGNCSYMAKYVWGFLSYDLCIFKSQLIVNKGNNTVAWSLYHVKVKGLIILLDKNWQHIIIKLS